MHTCEGGYCGVISYLLNLNQVQDLKFDIAYNNEVSLQTIGVYMKFPKEVLVAA